MGDVREELAALFREATLVGADYAPQLAERALDIVSKAAVEKCCAVAVVGRLPHYEHCLDKCPLCGAVLALERHRVGLRLGIGGGHCSTCHRDYSLSLPHSDLPPIPIARVGSLKSLAVPVAEALSAGEITHHEGPGGVKLTVTDLPPFAAAIVEAGGMIKYALASCEGGADVGRIAERYGGSGTERAATFTVER